MNYEDEPYVRLFIRRTLTNKRLGWEGRAVMHEMLYEFDRAGVFEFEGQLEDAVELMTQLPQKAVKVGLQRLLASKTWVVRDRFLVWPKFLEAQTCIRSDAARQRESRERRRDAVHAAQALGVTPVTIRDDPSRPVTEPPENVTTGHAESRDVTLCIAEPSSTDQDLAEHSDAGARAGDTPAQAKAGAYLRDPTYGSNAYGPPEKWPEVVEAFAAFKAAWPSTAIGKLRSRDPRALRIVERLADGYSVAELAEAARGAGLDQHFRSHAEFQNPMTIWRDPAQIDRFRALLHAGPAPSRVRSKHEPIQTGTYNPFTDEVTGGRRDAV